MAAHLPRTILVIDDEPSMVRALTGLLRRDGYLVGTASNGRHALAQIQERHYDVILCDLHMPELDGPAFYAILARQYPALRQRVIFSRGIPEGRPIGRFSRRVAARGCASPARSRPSGVPSSTCSRPSRMPKRNQASPEIGRGQGLLCQVMKGNCRVDCRRGGATLPQLGQSG